MLGHMVFEEILDQIELEVIIVQKYFTLLGLHKGVFLIGVATLGCNLLELSCSEHSKLSKNSNKKN